MAEPASLPMGKLVGASIKGVLAYPKGLALTAAYYSVLHLLIYLALEFAVEGGALYLNSLGGFAQSLPVEGNLHLWPWVTIVALVAVLAAGALFNMWIRYALLGVGNVAFASVFQTFAAAVISAIKFTGIVLLSCFLILAVFLIREFTPDLPISLPFTDTQIEAFITLATVWLMTALFAETFIKTAIGRKLPKLPSFQFARMAVVFVGFVFVLSLIEYAFATFLSVRAMLLVLLPFYVLTGAVGSAVIGYWQVWRLRVYLGEDEDEIPFDQSEGA